MSLKMEEIQPAAVAILEADPNLNGIEIIADDGTYPQTTGRETALATVGLCVIVSAIAGIGGVEITAPHTGDTIQKIGLHVVVEENPKINRARSGSPPSVEKVARFCMEALIGRPEGAQFPERFELQDNAWENYGKPDGVSRIVVNLQIQNTLYRS